MQLLERQVKETARDYAIRVLRHNIINIQLEPGAVVSENELASLMGLSRTPVREALIELSKSAIVEIFPQYGSMVSKIDYDKVEEASFTRRVVETALVRELCAGISAADLARLDDNLALQDLYLAKGDSEKLLAVDNEFHRQLFIIGRKRVTHELICSLSAHFDRVRRLSLVVIKDIRIVEDHHDIAEAIRSGDADRAGWAMHRHLTRYQMDKAVIRERYARYFAE